MIQKKIIKEILERAMSEQPDEKRFRIIKREICKKYSVCIPRKYDLYKNATKKQQTTLRYLLFKKPTRSISGVSVVAVMCKPHKCPHGSCTYCPKGDDAPQSYTGDEPATRRARLNKFSPNNQVKNRLDQLQNSGHPTDKIELIVMGGTFPSLSWAYQKDFIRKCLNAISWKNCKILKTAQKACETSKNRPIGITIETRPDYCKEKHIKRMLELGATRVELGVQTLDNRIYKKIKRGHTVNDVIEATKLMKNAGLKVCYHIMPGLPSSSFEKDIQTFKKLFSDQNFKPDMLKIYPTLVMPGTKLFDDWKKGKYTPLDSKTAARIVSKIKKFIPEWVRIMRVQRDIPSNLIAEGVKKSNLRQLAGGKCNCIRCREVGHKLRSQGAKELENPNIEIRIKKYAASGGTEYFISAEDFKQKILIGYLRLRKTQDKWIVRELHVYGTEVMIGKQAAGVQMQHRGWGKKLLKKAEEIADTKLYVLSGIGAREYYKKFGYTTDNFYVSKNL